MNRCALSPKQVMRALRLLGQIRDGRMTERALMYERDRQVAAAVHQRLKSKWTVHITYELDPGPPQLATESGNGWN